MALLRTTGESPSTDLEDVRELPLNLWVSDILLKGGNQGTYEPLVQGWVRV